MVDVEVYVDALFHGKLNIPSAASKAGITMDEMKVLLKSYIDSHPTEDWELDITPCWPYA
jgi:hypothetical protein